MAKKDLPKNLCIPYGGKYLTPREWKSLYKHCNDGGFHRISHTAEVDCLRDDGEVELGALDAHPTRMQQEQVPADAWPGAYCNQGATRAELNGKLLEGMRNGLLTVSFDGTRQFFTSKSFHVTVT